MPRSLLTNTIHAVGGAGLYYGCQLGVLVLLNKFATPAVTGQYLLALALATPVLLVLGLELRGAVIADTRDQFSIGTYLRLRTASILAAGVVLAAVLLWQARSETQTSFLLILAGVFVMRAAWTASEIGWGTFQRRERLDLVAIAQSLRGAALLVPVAVLLPRSSRLFPGDADQAAASATAAAMACAAAGFVLAYFLFDRPRVARARTADLTWSWAAVRRLAWQTAPLGLVAVVINLCDSFPRWLFEWGGVPDGKTQLGYFGSLAYITLAGNLLSIQAAQAAANRLARGYQRDMPAFVRLLAGLLGGAAGLGVLVVGVAVIWGKWILTTLYTPEYAQFEAEFCLVAAAHALALLTNILGAATTQMRLFWIQVPAQVITLGATVTAAIALIPGPTPVRGAAYTALLRAGVQFSLYLACVLAGVALRRRRIGERQPPPAPTPS